jgi:uncharacterized protein YjbJ (UPF0337 family)
MPNTNQKPQENSQENIEKLHRKIKEKWPRLSDDNIKLYSGKRDKFFDKLKEKHQVSTEDAKRKIEQLEKECGCTAKTA